MTFSYTDFVNGFWDETANAQGRVSVLSDTIKALAIDVGSYAADPDVDVVLADIAPSAILATADVSGLAVVARGLTFNPITFEAVPAGPDITAVVLYKDTGDPATSALMLYLDEETAAAGLPVVTDDEDVVVNPGAGGIAVL